MTRLPDIAHPVGRGAPLFLPLLRRRPLVHGRPPTLLRALCVATAIAAMPVAPAVLRAPLLAQQPDTTTTERSTKPLFTRGDAVAAGAFTLATAAAWPLDLAAARRLNDSSTQANRFFRHQANNVRLIAEPGSLIIGASLYGIGRATGNERMADLGLHGTEAIVVGSAVTAIIKGFAGRARPYVDRENPRDFNFGRGWRDQDYRSFPSGHTVMGFAAAAAVTSEVSRWHPESRWYVGPVLYGGAALVGASRMYHNKHWASDVAVGAMIGTFAGLKVVRYNHSRPENRLDKWLLAGTVSPVAGGGRALRWVILPVR